MMVMSDAYISMPRWNCWICFFNSLILKILFAKFCLNFLASLSFFVICLCEKHWKSVFQPAFGVRSFGRNIQHLKSVFLILSKFFVNTEVSFVNEAPGFLAKTLFCLEFPTHIVNCKNFILNFYVLQNRTIFFNF